MKKLLLTLALTFGLASTARAASVGLVLAYPEIAGVYVSGFLNENLSLDLQGTLATVDASVTGHVPVNRTMWGGTGSVLFSVLGGYVHNGVHNSQLDKRNVRFEGFGGFGVLTKGLDVRLLAGLSVREGADAWGAGFAAKLMLGIVF